MSNNVSPHSIKHSLSFFFADLYLRAKTEGNLSTPSDNLADQKKSCNLIR